ncbi:hypothetical protein D3C87_1670750 [compost metagenome]
MTLVIWPISLEACSIRPMASTALRTTAADSAALSLASLTITVASCARSVELLTATVISSSAADVSSRAAACCSVRFDRSSAAERSSDELPLIESVVTRTSRSVFCSVDSVSLTFFCSSAKAPWK